MKNFFKLIGITTLMVGSFIITDQIQYTSKISDNLLSEIKSKKDGYKENAIEPYINDNTIIPGLNGREVDVKKSYEEMSKIGYFDDKLLVYKTLKVSNSLDKNKDKYIVSLNSSNMITSLLFKVDSNDNISNIVNSFDDNKVKATFFIEGKYLEKHHNQIIKLVQNGYVIGNLSNNEDYEDSDFVWMKTILTNIGNQKNNYCLTNKKNHKLLKICKLQDSYTILNKNIIKQSPLLNIKKTLKPGSIIVLDVNKQLEKEIDAIIEYINSKGYTIKSLEEGLKE